LRAIGLDIGERRIGVALSDPTGLLASPLATIDRSNLKADIDRIVALIPRYAVERIVIGLPKSLSGAIGSQAEKVRAFAEKLGQRAGIPIAYWDERLTSVAAEAVLHQQSRRPSREKGIIDAVAASIILQGYLDSLRNKPRLEAPNGGAP